MAPEAETFIISWLPWLQKAAAEKQPRETRESLRDTPTKLTCTGIEDSGTTQTQDHSLSRSLVCTSIKDFGTRFVETGTEIMNTSAG